MSETSYEPLTGHGQYLQSLGACEEAIKWSDQRESLQDAWDNCERGDWLLWLAGKMSGPPESDGRRKLVLAACECARLVLPHVPEGEARPLKAIETAEAWARGEVTISDVRAAYDGAYDGAYAAAADAYDAYAAAAYAAYAAYAAADAADAAAAAAAAAADARTKTLELCADIVRKHYPTVAEEPAAKPEQAA